MLLEVNFVILIVQICMFKFVTVRDSNAHRMIRLHELTHGICVLMFNLLFSVVLAPQCVFYYSKTKLKIEQCNEKSDKQFGGFYLSLEIIIFLNFLEMPFIIGKSLTTICITPENPI